MKFHDLFNRRLSLKQLYSASKQQFIFYLLLTLIIYILYAINQSNVIDFIAINGKFQNYNVIRRLLNSQIPYIDFVPYLGPAHLWLTGIVTKLFGGTFGANVLANNIITILICPLMIFGLSRRLFLSNGLIPFIVCMMIIGLNDINIKKTSIFIFTLCNNLDGGISARSISGMILPISMILGTIWIDFCRNQFNDYKYKQSITHLGLSAIAGFAFCWSNDYGPCVLIATCIMVLMVTLIRTHSGWTVVRTFGVMCVGCALSIVIFGFLMSGGHLLAWLKGNFSTANYQQWYYNIPTNKVYYLYQIDTSCYTWIALGLFIGYLVQLIRNHADDAAITRYGLPAFCLLTSFGAAQEYHLFSGGGSPLHEILSLVIYTVLALELIKATVHIYQKYSNKWIRFGYIIMALAIVSFGIRSVVLLIKDNLTYPYEHAAYDNNLNGRLFYMSRDVSRTTKFLEQNPGTLFSMYASAAEVITNQFQPSGIDYVIHALSDESRATYIQRLEQSKSRYVTTIRETYSAGSWIRNANWFVYRKIYKNYHIVFRNSYEFFWVKNAPGVVNTIQQEVDHSVDIQFIDIHQTRITVTAPGIAKGIADVWIDYSTDVHRGFRSWFLINSVVGIYPNHSENLLEDLIKLGKRFNIIELDAWSLRPTSSEYIPVEIHNGIGTVLLRSYPEDNTSLHVHSAHCTEILTPSEVLMMQPVDDEFKSNE